MFLFVLATTHHAPRVLFGCRAAPRFPSPSPIIGPAIAQTFSPPSACETSPRPPHTPRILLLYPPSPLSQSTCPAPLPRRLSCPSLVVPTLLPPPPFSRYVVRGATRSILLLPCHSHSHSRLVFSLSSSFISVTAYLPVFLSFFPPLCVRVCVCVCVLIASHHTLFSIYQHLSSFSSSSSSSSYFFFVSSVLLSLASSFVTSFQIDSIYF